MKRTKTRSLILLFLFLGFLTGIVAQVTKTGKWRKTERDSFENAFMLYEDNLHKLAFPVYEAVLKNHPNEDFIRYMYGKTGLSRSDKHAEALEELKYSYDRNKKIVNIQYDLAKAYYYNYKFEEATELVNQFLAGKKLRPDEKEMGELLKVQIQNAAAMHAKRQNLKITNIGSPVNTEDEEYVPVINADESMMVFTYSGPKSKGGRVNAFGETSTIGVYPEDIYLTFMANDTFSVPKPLDNINSITNDASISLSPDGQILYLYRESSDDKGDIYESKLNGNEFGEPVKVKGLVNSSSWDGHCTVTEDGKTMYFSSERPGGFGGKDIYKATLLADSTWGNIVNLGDSINSKYDEDSPFIHPDGLTLFFSSNGLKSTGGYDIFMSVMEPDSTFKTVENMGYPINSPIDDIYFVVAANGKRGYYSSAKAGGKGLKDILMVETNFPSHKLKAYLVKGKTYYDTIPVEASFVIENLSKENMVFKNSKSNNLSGKYMSTMPAGSIYKISFTYSTLPVQSFTLDASQITEYTEKIIDVNFFVPKDTSLAKKDSLSDDNFKTKDKKLNEIRTYSRKYGDITAEGLEFKVQVAAYKYPKNYTYTHLDGLGKIDKTFKNGKVTVITVGPSFKSLGEAWELNKKAVNAGQKDAFVTAFYKGKRVYLADLVKMGIFKE
jgi:hypothetical protein